MLIGYWFIIMLNYLQYFYRAVINILFVIKEFKYDGKYMCTLFSLNTYDFIGKSITFMSK